MIRSPDHKRYGTHSSCVRSPGHMLVAAHENPARVRSAEHRTASIDVLPAGPGATTVTASMLGPPWPGHTAVAIHCTSAGPGATQLPASIVVQPRSGHTTPVNHPHSVGPGASVRLPAISVQPRPGHTDSVAHALFAGPGQSSIDTHGTGARVRPQKHSHPVRGSRVRATLRKTPAPPLPRSGATDEMPPNRVPRRVRARAQQTPSEPPPGTRPLKIRQPESLCQVRAISSPSPNDTKPGSGHIDLAARWTTAGSGYTGNAPHSTPAGPGQVWKDTHPTPAGSGSRS